VHILAFDDDGQIWLQRRSARKDECPRLYDSSAAGHLGCGESYEACAIREVREEMGIAIVPRYRFKIAACPETGWEHVAVYTCGINASVRFNEDEIESGGLFPVTSIAAWLDRAPEQFAPGFVKIFREFQRRGWR
jgi:isopentenyldiphosphate isomerase